MASQENQPPQENDTEPAEQAVVFLDIPPEIPKPPADFAPGFVNLRAFPLFDEEGRHDVEGFRDSLFHAGRYPDSDVMEWVTPDSSHIYVFIRNGAETRTQLSQRLSTERPLPKEETIEQSRLSRFTDAIKDKLLKLMGDLKS